MCLAVIKYMSFNLSVIYNVCVACMQVLSAPGFKPRLTKLRINFFMGSGIGNNNTASVW